MCHSEPVHRLAWESVFPCGAKHRAAFGGKRCGLPRPFGARNDISEKLYEILH